jgi:hypothetical protein
MRPKAVCLYDYLTNVFIKKPTEARLGKHVWESVVMINQGAAPGEKRFLAAAKTS